MPTKTMSKAKKPKKPKRKIIYTRTLPDYHDGIRILSFYACVKTGKKIAMVRISKKQYDRLNAKAAREQLMQNASRRPGGKRGAGEIPGAGHCWPLRCEALAVHPSQVEQMNERNKRNGVNVQYEPQHGIAIVPDEGAYKRLRKLEGVHFNNGYGS